MSKHKDFWNKEYKTEAHFALSMNPSEDLMKFTRWLERNREKGTPRLGNRTVVFDLGSGNGRNLIWLAQEFGSRGIGYDISEEGVKLAKKSGEGLPLEFTARSIEGKIDLPDESVDIVLDMMTSHFLKEKERGELFNKIVRVLKPGGYLFFKSFFAEGDIHVRRLLRDNAADEKNSYIHPKLGVYEHVWTEGELDEFFGPAFEKKKIEKSHKHIVRDRAFKRRTVSLYLQKNY